VSTAFVICGALGKEVKDIVDRRGWDVDIYGVSALLHLYPNRIVDEVRDKLHALRPATSAWWCLWGMRHQRKAGSGARRSRRGASQRPPLLRDARRRRPFRARQRRAPGHFLPHGLAGAELRPRGGPRLAWTGIPS